MDQEIEERQEDSAAGKQDAASAVPSRSDRAIADLEALWTAHVADSPVSRNTRLHNLAFEAKEALKTFLNHLDDKE